MFRDAVDEQGLNQMYDLFKKELTEMMKDVQNDQGNLKEKKKVIALLNKITSLLISYRDIKKKLLYVD